MKCPNCKKEIENDSVFCEWCGSKIQDAMTLNANKEMVKQFLERNAKFFPKKKISIIQEQLLKKSREQLENMLNCNYEKAYANACKSHSIYGFILQVLTISILIVLYYKTMYWHVDYFVDKIVIGAIIGISFLYYILLPSPKKKVYKLFKTNDVKFTK